MALKKQTIEGAFERVGSLVDKAFDGLSRISGEQSDPDLALYESLTEHDFEAIAQQYGIDRTIRYIRSMEAKRLRQGGS